MEHNELPRFSFFRAPILNVNPYKTITIVDAYMYIRGQYALLQTEELRKTTDPKQRRLIKASRFDYCTFSGEFTKRNDNNLVKHSNLMCIDFDHLQDVEKTAVKLLSDDMFETALLFVSPSGDGIKWVVEIEITEEHTHLLYFQGMEKYLKIRYNLDVDKSGKDISRACFLPHDQNAFINAKYLLPCKKENSTRLNG